MNVVIVRDIVVHLCCRTYASSCRFTSLFAHVPAAKETTSVTTGNEGGKEYQQRKVSSKQRPVEAYSHPGRSHLSR